MRFFDNFWKRFLILYGLSCRRFKIKDIQKIIQLLLPELLALIDGKNSPDLLQKGLDNKRIKSIHVVEKGVENGGN